MDARSMDGRRGRALKQRLESLADAGVTALPKLGRRASRPPRGSAATAPATHDAGAADAAGATSLAILRQRVVGCTKCAELAATRTQTVFGAGPEHPRIVFFGEAPGADEDASGEPFVGRAGQLLTKIIEACTLRREDVYIMNVLKCRPPGNRQPLPDEVANCRPFFAGQFAALRPEFICCLGTTAAQSLLQTTEPIGKLRHRWFESHGAQVICTYHPSYLLRNPAAKRDVWDDMKTLMAKMGVTL